MIEKIKNWLIKLLHAVGLYTKKEYANALKAEVEAKEALATVKSELNKTKAMLSYKREAYSNLFENYIALQMPLAAAKLIKSYCSDRDSCEGCGLHNVNGGCKLSNKACPEYWGAL